MDRDLQDPDGWEGARIKFGFPLAFVGGPYGAPRKAVDRLAVRSFRRKMILFCL